ncbi:MAG TPA: DNA repair protein RadC [Candidatus Saccharimonadales bacterium]|nr:DNA repair protein RadC [Candidatus Saccharimonadales bacterium]
MPENFKIKDLNFYEKPRERLITKGPDSLTDAELLAIILGSGGKNTSVLNLAQQILTKFGNLTNLLNTEFEQLKNIKHVGTAKACSIKAACEIGIRIATQPLAKKSKISKPIDVYKVLKKDLFEKSKEHLYLLSLDSRNNLIAADLLSIGTINETLVHPREIYRQALARNAVSIIIAHNHPSGNANPSAEDLLVTERIAKTGIELGLPLIDHIIISGDSYISLKALKLFSSKGGD